MWESAFIISGELKEMAIYDDGKAPITSTVNEDVANVPKSYFPMSRVHQCNGIIGAEMPIFCEETIPNDTWNLKFLVNVLSRNPLVRQLRNGMTVTLHAYWSPCSELWEGWNNFVTKGRSGKVNLEVPKLLPDFKNTNDSNKVYTSLVPCSPSDYMGVPIKKYDKTLTNKNYVFKAMDISKGNWITSNYVKGDTTHNNKWGITALPFVMYNKIHRDYYMNNNIMQNNKSWFPDNDKDFILPYNPTTTETNWGSVQETHHYVNCLDKVNFYVPSYAENDESYYNDTNTNSTKIDKPWLNKLHFRQFRGDYFTTANPFANLLRGDNSIIDDAIGGLGTFEDTINYHLFHNFGTGQTPMMNIDSYDHGFGKHMTNYTPATLESVNKDIIERLNKSFKTAPNLLNKIRKAIVLEKFMQRNGCVNGTYRDMIGVQYGYKPNQFDGKPRYIGGGTFEINFDSITASAETQTTVGSDTITTALGDKVSSGSGNGVIDIGSYHCDDYGYLMVIMSIVPDVYYNNNGLRTMWTRTTWDKIYFPIMNNLDPQPILNKELFLNNETDDNDLFGYTERFSDMKTRQNIVTGLGACGSEAIYDSSNIMKRKFNATPQLNNKFLTMYPDNIDLTPFYSVNEIPFDIMIGEDVSAERPIPYSSKPSDMGIKY